MINNISKELDCNIDEVILRDNADSDIHDVCNFLRSVDERNRSCCRIIDSVEQIDITGKAIFLLHMNILSLPAHFEELEAFLSDLHTVSKPMIIGICEIWLSKSNEPLFSLSGYNCL